MQWGIVFEKDAGERFWSSHKKGIDYSSFHFLLKNQKRIKTLILGDYQLRFGQGLACSNNFSLGKSVTGTIPELTGNNLSRHFSTSESNFFRGIGSTFILKPYPEQGSENRTSYGLDMTTFVSLRNKDAAISEGSFSTLSTSELHRTKTEIELMDQLKTYTLGTHFSLRTSQGQFGFTALTYGFNAYFNPEWKPYNVFYFRGKHGGNASLDYRFRYKGLLFFGESAVDERANLAILSGLSLKPYTRLDMSILLRYYATDYHALYGNGFSESTSTQNECGSFATIEWRLIKKWRFNAYYDVFCFPWLKYYVHSPSFGFDYALQATWIPTATSLISIRFKSKTKARNATDGSKTFKDVVMQQKDQLRLQISTKTGAWTLKTVLDGSRIISCLPKAPNFGFSASQEADLSPEQTSVSLSVKYAIFDAENYDSRIYSYEKDLPGTFAMTSFYGQGSRLSILFTYKISEFAKIQLKMGQTAYRDRLQVGTGPEQIQGNRLTDVKGMFLWKF